MILRQWIIWSTFLGCFSGAASFYIGSVHLLWFYPVVIFNLALLLLAQSLWFPPGLLFLIGYTLFSGIYGVLDGTNTIALFCKSEVGIVINAVYACAFFRFMRFNVASCLQRYAETAFYVALFGLVTYPILFAQEGLAGRLRSIEYEPGEFCIVCLPALYYFADQWHRHRKHAYRFLLMAVAILLSQSSIGLMGVFVGLYLFIARFRFGVLFAPVIVLLAGAGAYTASSAFQARLSDSITGFRLLDASDLNYSSFSLISGGFVAAKALINHPLMGEGLGSISLVNSRYIGQLGGLELLPDDIVHIAGGDGGSMLFRLAAEGGLLGLMLALGTLWYCFPRHSSTERKQIALAILVYAFVKLLRSGVYFNPEVMFLFVLYAVNGAPSMNRVTGILRAASSPVLRAEEIRA